MLVQLTEAVLEPAAVMALVQGAGHGGVVTFLGTTRDTTEGRAVRSLEYEAYQPMALQKLQEVRQAILAAYPVGEMAIAHRLGHLAIGEVSLVVAVGAPHRREAFAACAEAVDRIKQLVPIWKREVFQDGAVWVGAEGPWSPLPSTPGADG